MARLNINVGSNANDGTGDDLRTAMQKINTNFTELYGTTAEANDLVEDASPQLGGNLDLQNYTITTSNSNGDITITPNGTGSINLGSITLQGSKISANDSTRIRIAEGLDVTGSVVLDGNLKLASGTTVTEFTTTISEDSTAVSHSKVPTQQAVYEFVNDVVVSASSIIMVGDDSTGTPVTLGETFKIAGAQNVTTAVSGDTLTVTGPDLTSYATTAYVDSQITGQTITFVGDDSTGTAVGTNETFKIAGAQNVTTAVSGDTLTVTGPDLSTYLTDTTLYVVGDDSATIAINNNGTLLFNGERGVTTSTDSSGAVTITGPDLSSYLTDITLNISADDSATIAVSNNGGLVFSGGNGITTSTTSGGSVTISRDTISNLFSVGVDDSTTQNIGEGDTLTIEGGTGLATSFNGNTVVIELTSGGGVGSVGDLTVSGQQIIGTQSNSDITVTPNGVGDVILEADVIKVGDPGVNATISSNGAADLILKTDVDNPSVGHASITLEDGQEGNISIEPGEHGYTKIGNGDWNNLWATSTANRHLYGLSAVDEYEYNIGAFDVNRRYAHSIGAKFTIRGTDPDNGNVTGYRGLQTELVTDLDARSLLSKGWITFDSSSRNAGIQSGESGGQARSYGSGPIALGVQNIFRNTSSLTPVTVEETANISSYTPFYHQSIHETITVNNLIGVGQSFALAEDGGTTVVGNIKAFTASGNWVSNGSATVTNYYGFYARGLSEAVNNWGVYVESPDWENYLGGLTIVDNTIRADRSDDNIILETAGAGKVIVNDILNVDSVELNNISSADSSAVTVNDNLDISGTLLVNDISSADSSAVQINDAVNISGTLSVNNIDTNTISSVDSSAIQINDDLNISGVLTVAGNFVANNFITNTISSNDSTAVTINDNLDVSGTLLVNDINSADSSEVRINSALSVGGTVSTDTLDTNVISSGDSSTLQVNDSVKISDNLTMGGMLTLANRTVAELNLLTPPTGSMAYCTNESGGAQPVFYDGTNWRRLASGDLAVITA